MSASTRLSASHPARLISIVLVDGPLGHGQNYRRLTCYGAFEVSFVDGEPAFKSHHVSTTNNERRSQVIRDLGAMSDDRFVVVGSSEAQETFWHRRHILEAGLAYLDTIHSLNDVQPSNLYLMAAPEHAMMELAAKFRLRNCYQSGVLERARSAGERAQLVWLAYVTTTFSAKRAQKLFAAFLAWQAIEMARPNAF